jgi:putative copper export protein
VLPITADTIRVFLHVLAATIWVGGQLTLAGLVPGLRTLSPDAPRTVARRFNRIAWPAFAVLIITGIWNIGATTNATHGKHGTTLAFKLAAVVVSGLAAWAHSVSHGKFGLAFFGAVSALAALAALFLGVLLAG